jgi:hypothetical protein
MMVGVCGLALVAAERRRLVSCRAVAAKKKGVRVVEGNEISWNLFSPKAPYKAKVLSKETVTSKTHWSAGKLAK